MSYLDCPIKELIVNNHDDIFVKNFVEYVYNNPNVTENDLKHYTAYFAENAHLLDNLINTLDQIVKEFNF